MGKAALAKKALKLALDQHPKSTGLKLVQVEMLVYDDKLDIAENYLMSYAIEPTNEEIFIQKLISILKETNTIRRLNY
jgi:predicted Zn-dependent protease